MRRRIVSAMLALLLLTALPSTAFAHTADIPLTGEHRYKSLRLTPEIYKAANRDLSDLRIVDSAGQPVPYFIRTGGTHEEIKTERYPLELIDAYLKEDRFYFDYRFAGELKGDIVATSIEFSTREGNFAKEAELYGSHDNLHWELVERDTLYAVGGYEKLEIAFTQPQKFTYYRLSLANNLEQIAFDSVALVYSETRSEEISFIETIRPSFSVEAGQRQTLIHIDDVTNLRLCDVTLETGSMFQRMVTVPGGVRKELYHLAFEGAVYADTTLPLSRQISSENRYTLAIADGDDKPIEVTGISVRYYADELVFEGAPGETYTLEFGADQAKTTPVYDIARYSDEILRSDIDRVELAEIAFDQSEESTSQQDYTFVFNVVIIVVALLLGGVFLTKLRKR